MDEIPFAKRKMDIQFAHRIMKVQRFFKRENAIVSSSAHLRPSLSAIGPYPPEINGFSNPQGFSASKSATVIAFRPPGLGMQRLFFWRLPMDSRSRDLWKRAIDSLKSMSEFSAALGDSRPITAEQAALTSLLTNEVMVLAQVLQELRLHSDRNVHIN